MKTPSEIFSIFKTLLYGYILIYFNVVKQEFYESLKVETFYSIYQANVDLNKFQEIDKLRLFKQYQTFRLGQGLSKLCFEMNGPL